MKKLTSSLVLAIALSSTALKATEGENNRLILTEVEGKLAESGVKVGDEVISVNGLKSGKNKKFIKAFFGKGKKVIHLLRDGEELIIEVQ